MVPRYVRPLKIVICAAVVAVVLLASHNFSFLNNRIPQIVLASQEDERPRNRRLEIGVVNSDEYAESVMTISPKSPLVGIGEQDHAEIIAILASTRKLIDIASVLVQDERTLKEGKEMYARATANFREVKDHVRKMNNILHDKEQDRDSDTEQDGGSDTEQPRKLLQKSQENDDREIDIVRELAITIITFPECVEQLFDHCIDIINESLADLGLTEIEVVTHDKRNIDQDNYYKVVIITNELADRVIGRDRDKEGIVHYPYIWNDSLLGSRALGVNGESKWDCYYSTPEDCCKTIQADVPNPDVKGNMLSCHIFVPYGGVGKPRRNDRVFIKLSPDGRVHEPPIIE